MSRVVSGFIFLLLLAGGCQTVAPSPAAVATVNSESPVVFKFVTVGDSRGDPKQASAQDRIWLQATAVWSRMLSEIERQHPQALMFNGDMIYGYTSDMAAIDRQYAFWRGMVAGLMERGTYVLPVAGNHEVQLPLPNAQGGTVKRAQVAHENAWRANMGDLILNQALWQKIVGAPASAWRLDNTPAIGVDGISTDQRQLSYSFDSGAMHFAMINTDPVGFDESAPVTWLEGDLAAARARGATHFFVFGHKPAFTYFPQMIGTNGKDEEDGFGSKPALRDRFWDLMEAYGAIYFCGHQHIYHASQPRLATGGKAWQIIVGTAGSPLNVKPGKSADPVDSLYAWAEVSVRRDDSISILVRGFDDAGGKTIAIDRWTIAPAVR